MVASTTSRDISHAEGNGIARGEEGWNMPASVSKPVALVWGEDSFSVKGRARQLYQQWCDELGGMDHEIIDASANHSGEALKALARLREALQTLPFFGSAKVIWFQNCNFLGDERTAAAQAVSETLGELADELAAFSWDNVRLLISAGKVDKRRAFYKALEKIGQVEVCGGLSMEDRDWADRAGEFVVGQLKSLGKQIAEEALAQLVVAVGPNLAQLQNESEKLATYVGDRLVIETQDVGAVVARNKQARAFALGDALGDRDLARLLQSLDQELWEMEFDRRKSEIGLLYGLIAKVRTMLLAKELIQEGWLKPEREFSRFKAQVGRLPAERFPEDKRFSPLGINPYVLFRASHQARNYSPAELVRAMELLLRCNQRLVLSDLDEAMVLQQTLVEICDGQGSESARRNP